ncbi:hypothetical protein CHS0354_030127 [Potamilus streckersoni]|uniref:Neurotransmitter-gated ion-channel ligand-binding domain-containing protein n=1 Tax=Potamilus streckersoni TaxID=2493646 RepID=A0AAE0W145_9BIVA|nr:hypothetical protein CHS0354_030127 [Potamilus streckersoni]
MSLIYVLLLTAIMNTCSGEMPREKLTKALLENYVKSVKPEPSDGSQFKLTVGLTLVNLDDVDDDNKVIETHSYMDQTWKDERLAWDPSDFNDVRVLHLPADSIWIPDIALFNNAGDNFKPMIDVSVIVYSDGTVNYIPPYHLKSFCETEKQPTGAFNKFSLLRYNELVCKLKVGSWTYDGHEISLVSRSSQIDMSEFRRFPADKFQVKSTSVQVDQKVYSCCPEPYETAVFTIVLTNNPKYYYDSSPISAEDIVEAQAHAQATAQAQDYPRRYNPKYYHDSSPISAEDIVKAQAHQHGHRQRHDSPEVFDDHHRSVEDRYDLF